MTPQERTLAKHYAVTNDVAYASERAGYAYDTAGHKALRRPGVQEQVAAIREQRAARAAIIAFNALEEIAQDAAAGKMPRVSAADKLLKASGLYNPNQAVDETHLEAHELPIDVLRARVARWIAEDLEPIEEAPDLAAIHPCLG